MINIQDKDIQDKYIQDKYQFINSFHGCNPNMANCTTVVK